MNLFLKRLSAVIIRLFDLLFPKPVTVHFVAGEDWMKFALKKANRVSKKNWFLAILWIIIIIYLAGP